MADSHASVKEKYGRRLDCPLGDVARSAGHQGRGSVPPDDGSMVRQTVAPDACFRTVRCNFPLAATGPAAHSYAGMAAVFLAACASRPWH